MVFKKAQTCKLIRNGGHLCLRVISVRTCPSADPGCRGLEEEMSQEGVQGSCFMCHVTGFSERGQEKSLAAEPGGQLFT